MLEQRLLELCVLNAEITEITVSTSKVFGSISIVFVTESLKGGILPEEEQKKEFTCRGNTLIQHIGVMKMVRKSRIGPD